MTHRPQGIGHGTRAHENGFWLTCGARRDRPVSHELSFKIQRIRPTSSSLSAPDGPVSLLPNIRKMGILNHLSVLSKVIIPSTHSCNYPQKKKQPVKPPLASSFSLVVLTLLCNYASRNWGFTGTLILNFFESIC